MLLAQRHDAICLEIGRLVIEICATLAQQSPQKVAGTSVDLDKFASSCRPEAVARIMVYMATKLQSEASAVAHRVWFALGLLSTVPGGRVVVQLALQDADVQLELRRIDAEGESWATGNIKFMMHNLGDSLPQTSGGLLDGLDCAMDQMSLL